MIPYDIDPSLHSALPEPQLEDGFSAPRSPGDAACDTELRTSSSSLHDALANKSEF